MKNKPLQLGYFASISSKDVVGWLSIPIEEPGQRINTVKIIPNPSNVYNDKFNNQIAYFKFNNVSLELELKLEVYLENYSLKKEQLVFPKKGKLFDLYTCSEPFLKQNSQIKKLAVDIRKKSGNNDVDALKEAFLYTINNFKYKYPIIKRGTENLSLAALKGDCGEYTAFLVTLIRCLGIPARPSTGFVLYEKSKKVQEHAWASVYVSNFGWVDLDAQYASLEKNTTTAFKKYFLTRSDKRISFTHGYNITLKPPISSSYNISYWNKIGLPLRYNSVQTLQPFICVTKKPSRLKYSIKFL